MKRLVALLCSVTLLASSYTVFAENGTSAAEDQTVVEIHVSPNGNDYNEGTAEKPLQTLEGAKNKVKATKDTKKTIKVIFHEGEYRLNNTVKFTRDDSGADDNPVIYMAAEGEKPVFKGSVELDTSKFTAITNKGVIDILPDQSADKVAQLDLKSQGVSVMGALPRINYGGNVASYNGLYLDNIEQPLSRWPNNGYAVIDKVVDVNTAVFEVTESNAARWGHSPNMRFHGFAAWDWAYERAGIESVDPETRQIKLVKSTLYGQKLSIKNGRYCIVNILEELDEPGEWYVDEKEMILYYYPAYPVTKAKLELSVLSTAMLTFDGASNIVFDGFGFEQTMQDAICLKNTENIVLTNNSYKNIGRNAIGNFDTGTVSTSIPNTNTEISYSTFYNIGSSGVQIYSGNEDTLESGGIVISNNHFSRCGQLKRSYQGAINIAGVGVVIEHNVIEDMPHMGIGANGALHQINYNEIFNVCTDSNDMGAIYAGRQAIWRGTEVKYNYIHDIVPEEGLAGLIMGVYWDDSLSGQIAMYNIFENIPTGIMTNGGNDHYEVGNIFIDCPRAIRHGYTAVETPNQDIFITALAKAEAFPVYYEKFPDMKNIDTNWTRSHNNRVLNNYMVNSLGNAVDGTDPEMWSGQNLLRQNLSKGNVVVGADYSSFVDPENGNYEIKPDAEILKTLPDLAKIKMADIGLQKEIPEEEGDFIKIYPKNGQTNISASGFYMKWQPSEYYTKYRVMVATDPEMKNIVFEKDTIRNYVFFDGLKSGGKKYYWNVEGIADSATTGLDKKNAVGAVYSFSTVNREKLDQIILSETIAAADKLYASVTPGSESGQCEASNLIWFKGIIDKSKQVNALKFGDQNEVDKANEELRDAIHKMNSYIHKGYASIGDWLEKTDNWKYMGDNAAIEDGILTVKGGSHAMYGDFVKTYNIYKFKVKIEDFKHMFVVAYKTNSIGNAWTPGSVNYSFYLKNNIFEFQRYVGGTGGIIDTQPNDGLLKEGEWAEVAVGAMDVPGGIQVYVTINGEEIFNYFDDTGAVAKEGYMQFSSYGPVIAQVQAVEELGEFDQSVVMGGTVEYKDPVDFDNSLLTAENIKATKGAVNIINGETVMKGTAAENSFKLNKEVESNNIYTFNAKITTEGDGQAIGILGKDAEDEYRIQFTGNTIELIRHFGGKKQTLFVGDNNYFDGNIYATVRVGSCSNEYGTRIFLYINGEKVFDCTDMYKKIKLGGLRFYDNNMKGMIIR